jgi:predicted ferric reductase
MRTIKLSFWSLLLGLSVLWVLANIGAPATRGFFPVRHLMMQYTGVLGIGVMSVAMILATRPLWLEPYLGGLDKFYRLHKWLGIAALTVAIVHWLWANGPKWAVGLGLMNRPQHRGDLGTLSAIQQFLREQRGVAELIGEWAFYAVVLLIALALIKWFPYRLFAKTHKILAVAYLALVLHAVVLMEFRYWTEPVGVVTGVLMAGGVVSAIMVLFNLIGRRHQAHGTIESLEYYPEVRVLETAIRLDEDWRGHKAGQFAFVTFNPKEGAHPFTLAHAWNPDDRREVFITKGLGDYTNLLPDLLRVGDRAKIEGPYGRFTFDDQNERQIWIGGGIGITPFIARMKHLSRTRREHDIDLYYTSSIFDTTVTNKLTADAEAANVRLHILIDDKDGRLDGARIRSENADWRSASVWFCGPTGFGKAVRDDLVAHGLAPKHFHQELFNLR